MKRAKMPPPREFGLTVDGPRQENAAEILRQALQGFLPPTDALFHLFDRMEMPR